MSRINVFEKYAYLVGQTINKWTVLEIKNNSSHPDANRFDFYLPQYNLFIEFDGSQHYKPARYKGSDTQKNLQDFEDVQRRDKLKNKYCAKNKINLLRIPYYESKNIDSIICNHLQRLNDKDFVKAA